MRWHKLFQSGLESFAKTTPNFYEDHKAGRVFLYIGKAEHDIFRDHVANEIYLKQADPKEFMCEGCHYLYAGVKVVVVLLPHHFHFSHFSLTR